MSALTMSARLGTDTDPRPVPWRRMAWVTWRQHRFALVGMTALLGVLAVGLWVAGLQLHHAYATATACPAGPLACGDLVNTFNGTNGFLANGVILQVIPVLTGAFIGAPVLARELETGTYRYAWTQGIGRVRWTVTKLALLGSAIAVAVLVITQLSAWFLTRS